MEDVFLIDVDVDHIVAVARGRGDIILDGIDAVVDEQFLAVHIAREATDAVIEGDDIRIKAVEEIIQGVERRNAAARRHVDIGPESHDTLLGMAFGIGMDGQMALVEMTNHIGIVYFFFGNEDGNTGPLGVIILAGDVEDVGADDVRHVAQDFCQPVGIVLFIDVFDVLTARFVADGITNIIHVEAQGLGQVVEPVELEFIRFHESYHPFLLELPFDFVKGHVGNDAVIDGYDGIRPLPAIPGQTDTTGIDDPHLSVHLDETAVRMAKGDEVRLVLTAQLDELLPAPFTIPLTAVDGDDANTADGDAATFRIVRMGHVIIVA